MSTAKPTPDTPRVSFENSEIRKAERDLLFVEQAQSAVRRSEKDDIVVGTFGTHDVMGIAANVVTTKRGHVYAMSDREDDWRELPPVPGTKARAEYDEVRMLKERIATLRAAIGQLPEAD